MTALRFQTILPKRFRMLSRRKKWIYTLYTFALVFLISIIWANAEISSNATGKLFWNVEKCPEVKVALIPGTSKYRMSGRQNMFFNYRINAATDLYKAGKIRFILISGDHSSATYNEPADMKKDLIAKGIPAERIYLDGKGFDTWASMERALKVFGTRKLIVISQQFQNERAIYIGESLGMTVYGFNAKDVQSYGGFKTLLREKFARLKVFSDMLWGHSADLSGKKTAIE